MSHVAGIYKASEILRGYTYLQGRKRTYILEDFVQENKTRYLKSSFCIFSLHYKENKLILVMTK